MNGPCLARMGGRVTYWKKRRTDAKEQNIRIDIETQKTLGIEDSGDTGLDYINTRLRIAWKELHETQKRAGILRETHLEELAAYKGEADGTTAAREL